MAQNGLNGETNGQNTNTKWFTEGEFLWRTGASVAWLILCTPCALLVFVGVVSMNVFHPFTWLSGRYTATMNILRYSSSGVIFSAVDQIKCTEGLYRRADQCSTFSRISDVFSSLFAIYFWFVIIFYGIITGFLVISNNKFNSVQDVIHNNRISYLLFLLYPYHLFHMFLYSVGGMFSTWFLLSVNSEPFDSLTTFTPESEEECFLNEHGVFLLTFGGWLGCYASMQYVSKKEFHFTFPVIQQRKFFRIKAVIWPCVYQAVVLTFKALRWYYPLYYLFGNIPKNLFAGFLVASNDSNSVPLNSLPGMLNFSLLWVVFSLGTLLSFMWILGNNLFIIFNTQAYQFPIESAVTQEKDKCLPVVIKTKKSVPLLRYLVFLDLSQLSQFNSTRRKQIFCLTQPGGRPANWTSVSEECLSMLNSFTADLNSLMEYQTHQRQLNSEQWRHGTPTNRPLDSLSSPAFTNTPRTPTPRGTPLSSSTSRPRLWTSIREESTATQRLSSSRDVSSFSKNTPLQNVVSPDNKKVDTLQWRMMQIPHNFARFMKERPVIRYLFNEIPGARTEALFADCQLQIWAVQGLSRLVVASFTEDTFGVVQKTLSDILTTLLALLQALDRYAKFPAAGYQASAIQPRPPRPQGKEGMRYNLRATLVSSIYHISNTFGHHLNAVPLSHDHRSRLQAFLDNRE